MWVKVCGLSRPEEVAAAAAAGADAVGFVSVHGSPRFLELGQVAPLADGVPGRVRRVLLTLDLAPGALLAAVEAAHVDGVQPYGRHRAEAAVAAAGEGLFVLEPVPSHMIASYPEPAAGVVPLFDTPVPGKHGGTGTAFDWSLLADREGDFVVAGGLGPDNVGQLVQKIGPWGVDASSRLEQSPGVKDLGKVTAFVQEAKRA